MVNDTLYNIMSPKAARPLLAFVLSTGVAAPVQAACFTIYDEKNTIVYQSTDPPVDLSQQISAAMARRYPRQFLVMAESNDGCVAIGSPAKPVQVGADAAGAVMDSPLFRNAESSISALGYSGSASYGASWAYPFSRGGHIPSTDVSVRSYQRRDGTVVQSHTRSAPGRGR